MSRASSRASTAAAIVVIVLLVVLVTILWLGVKSANFVDKEATESRAKVVNDTVDDTPDIDQDFSNEVFNERRKNLTDYKDTTIDILPKGKGTLEYITPLKLAHGHYEDTGKFSELRIHDTGHFRHVDAQLWDPNPQYEFTAFGRLFRLQLAHDSSFVAPDIRITHISQNTARRERPDHQLGCLYSGVVDGDPASSVSVSLCHGITGHIRTSGGSYYIKPAEYWRDDKESIDAPLQHAIYRERATPLNSNNVDVPREPVARPSCGVIDYDTDEESTGAAKDVQDDANSGGGTRVRRSLGSNDTYLLREYGRLVGNEQRRSYARSDSRYDSNRYYPVDRRHYPLERHHVRSAETESDPFVTVRPRRALPQEYFIEIMVVTDAGMTRYHGNKLINYILVLMSTVYSIYKDPSIGNPISIAVTKIVRTDQLFGTRDEEVDGVSVAEMLKKFCQWQKHHNTGEISQHHDIALLLTRETLCDNLEQKSCNTLGYAHIGRMCTPGSSCAIVQDNGLAAAFTIAHEIGHALNMPHDIDDKCAGFGKHSRMHNIMSPSLGSDTFPWEWSKCSQHYVTEFLSAHSSSCLLNRPREMMKRSDDESLPGERYSKNRQCELAFGVGSRTCHREEYEKDVCRYLFCTVRYENGTEECKIGYMPLAEGTPCAKDKWCHHSKCVAREKLQPIHGQWGDWGPYGSCTRTCGGGIQRRKRDCDNPRPQNNGNYCLGQHYDYRSCNTHDCPLGSPNFRQAQCSEFDNNNLNNRDLPRDVKWTVKYIEEVPSERCNLYCESNHKYLYMGKRVIDGTPCGPDTFHMCVNGRCIPAGCDHILYSTAKLDDCGVCNGDNSTCHRITGTYNESRYDYTNITKIPAGSRNIDIRQHGWQGQYNDSNYLVLRLANSGKYILNGNYYSITIHHKILEGPGYRIEYSGSEPVVERLNSSKAITTDLILEVLSVGQVNPPQITFAYTVPKMILNSFTWVLNDWSNCNSVCHGMMHRKAQCRNTENKDVVPDDYCHMHEKPREESKLCNTQCILKWHVVFKSECSSHCGPGVRSVISHCIQIMLNSHINRTIPDHVCSHLDRPSEYENCSGTCHDARWRYDEWGSCSVTCGGGVQYRRATCVDSNGKLLTDDACANVEKHLHRLCGQKVCPKWDYGEWTTCSATCGKASRQRPHWCQVDNQIVSPDYCKEPLKSVIEMCDLRACHQWHAGDWGMCSVTCGKGTQRRSVVCKNADGTNGNECPTSEKPEESMSCSLEPCPVIMHTPQITYSSGTPHEDQSQHENEIDSHSISFRPGYKWRSEPFGECSASCNGGIMIRVVKCVAVETGATVRKDFCSTKEKPPHEAPCNEHECPTHRRSNIPKWDTGDWSMCNVECGHGVQHRQVRCRNYRGDILKDEECSYEDKPRNAKRCQKAPCVTSVMDRANSNIIRRWRVSNWTPCSKSCGSGVKRRRVECTMKRGMHGHEVHVKDEQCSKLGFRKPRWQRPCQRFACSRIWQEGSWSECSAECGKGTQRRAVTCHRVNGYGWTDPSPTDGCSMQEKPATDQVCELRKCTDDFYWTAGPWRKCSHMCGRKGRQVRRLFCHDRYHKKVARMNCNQDLMPHRKRKCNQKKCGPTSCYEAQKQFNTKRDGEYELLIGGRKTTIYCHNMSTNEPLEYLTLPYGDLENYAEIYDKRLKNPTICPYEGRRNDSCNCVTDLGTISGRTMFQRIRIDPVKLYIIANDYTFSWTEGSNRVEFGKAGDCYSTKNCPQGRFSINLSGTPLRLSPDVTWVTEKTRRTSAYVDVNRINDQRVLGRCGGYCGFCTPKTGLKLDVLPP